MIPWDRTVGLTTRQFTPATERLVTLAGSLSDSFQEAAEKVLPEMAGLRIAETTVQRTTEGVGQRLAEHLRQGRTFGFPNHWQWHKDALGRTCAYLSLDLTGVRQQAKDGGAAEGRMPYVAMVYNPVPELPKDSPHRPPAKATMQARYLSGLYDLDELGLRSGLRLGRGCFHELGGDPERACLEVRVFDDVDLRRADHAPTFAGGSSSRHGRKLLSERGRDLTQPLVVLVRKIECEGVRNVRRSACRGGLLLVHRAHHPLAELDRLNAAARERAREEPLDEAF